MSEGLSLNPEFTGSARLADQKNQDPLVSTSLLWDYTCMLLCLDFYVGAVDPNWGPHVCMPSILTDGSISPSSRAGVLGLLMIALETASSSSLISTAGQGQVHIQSQVVESCDPATAGDRTLGCRRVPVTAFAALGMGGKSWKWAPECDSSLSDASDLSR